MYKVGIIGAGPAGIAIGAELIEAGISPDQILVCEKSDKNCASVRQFYPVGKDINSVYKNIETSINGVVGFSGIISVDKFFDLIQKKIDQTKLSINYSTEVQKITKTQEGFLIETADGSFQAENVVLASGVFSKPRRPDYSFPPKLLSKISFDILQFQKENISNLNVLVVGGGDSASEYVQTLAHMGNTVTLSYRQDNFFRMNQLNKDRLNVLKETGKVSCLLSTNIQSLEECDGKITVNFSDHEPITVDRIVYSLGGASPTVFMNNCGIDYDDTNVILNDYKETQIPKLFMIGDLAQGRKGGSLLLAFNHAREVMEGLHKKYQFPKPKSIN